MSLQISIHHEIDWLKEQEMWNYDEGLEENSPEESISKANSPNTFIVSQNDTSNWFSNKGQIKEDGKQHMLEELSVLYIRQQRAKTMRNRSSDSFQTKRGQDKNINFSCVVDLWDRKEGEHNPKVLSENNSETKSPKNFQMTEDIKYLLRNLAEKNEQLSSRQQLENFYVTMKDVGRI